MRQTPALKRYTKAVELLETMTANVIESHCEEYEDNHGGDADHKGEAPEVCSYCHDIQETRDFIHHPAVTK